MLCENISLHIPGKYFQRKQLKWQNSEASTTEWILILEEFLNPELIWGNGWWIRALYFVFFQLQTNWKSKPLPWTDIILKHHITHMQILHNTLKLQYFISILLFLKKIIDYLPIEHLNIEYLNLKQQAWYLKLAPLWNFRVSRSSRSNYVNKEDAH